MEKNSTQISGTNDYTVLDAETTTYNKGHPHDPRNKLVSYAYKSHNSNVNYQYFSDPGFSVGYRACNTRTNVLVGFHVKFDAHWAIVGGLVHSIESPIWDCQLAEHVYTGQKAQYISLSECLDRYDLGTKKDIVKEMWDAGYQTTDIPLPVLQEYNEWDVIQTEKLFLVQQELLSDEQKRLVYLMGEDLKVLAHIERSGLLFDSAKAAPYLATLKEQVATIELELAKRLPPIQHGVFNWDSGDHLSCFLYGGTLTFNYAIGEPSVYKSGAKKGEEYTKNSWFEEHLNFPQLFKPLPNTELKKTKGDVSASTRFYQTDLPTLSSLKGGGKEGKQVVAFLLERSAKTKVVEMLESIFKLFDKFQWTDNLVHGQYNQNVAVTGRLSSSAPNMQNIPPEIDQFFISRYA